MSVADRPPRRGFDVGSAIPVIGAAVPVIRAIAGEPKIWFGPTIRALFGGRGLQVITGQRAAVAPTVPPGAVPFPQLPPAASQPSQPGYRPDLTERKVPPLKKPPSPPKPPKPPKGPIGPDAKPPSSWRGNAQFIVFAIAAQYGIEAVRRWLKTERLDPELDREYKAAIEQWERAQIERRKREREAREDAGMAEISKKYEQERRDALARAAVEARKRYEAERDRILYEPIVITAKRVPVPKPVVPKTYLGLTLKQYGQLATLAGPLLFKDDKQKRAKVQALTTVNVPSVGLQPQSSVSYFGGIAPPSTPTRTKKCECPPKKKRGPKKKRTVCYSGTYTERASGLRKAKRRKVPCR